MSRLSAVEEFSRPCPTDGYYDVFISFRGIDTRSGFTDNLYHSLLENKIYTFIDADLAGKVIESLFKIIERSRMAVVVYSEKFASSDWCLRELETIMQHWEEEKMLMIPIFYKVDAHELKHPTEKNTKYFDQHIIKYGETVVEKWKNTVTKIGNVSGFPYKDIYGRSERDFITHVTAIIKKQLGEWEETLEIISKPYNIGPSTEHDVFISFMGKDTRYGLVSHLYKALKIRTEIKTIMVEQDLSKDDSIFEVIQQSKMAVVVFSENYSSSKWCLRELVKIIQCNNTTGQEVLPIFYEITPTDLINQAAKGSRIAYHLEKHVRDEESDTVQSWRDAITDLGYMVGWRFSNAHSKTELAEFIGGLVEEISTTLNRLEDEKKESDRNQQALVSTEEESKQALAVQTDDAIFASTPTLEPESEKKSLNEKAQENQDLLVKCISQKLGFSGGKIVAACVIYKCLLHWRSFEVERTGVFDRIIQTINDSIQVQDNNDVLAYWLSNASTLLSLLQHTLNATGAASLTPQRRRTSYASLFGRMTSELRSSPQSPGLPFLNSRGIRRLDDLRQVEAKYPALLFKQQLTALVEKMYGIIRDNLKKDISPLLALCIQAPRTMRASRNQDVVVQQALLIAAYWRSIVTSLDNYLSIMKANLVHPLLVHKVFTQIFSFINVQLFNSFLLRRECCSFSNGEYVESGLSELEMWCCGATEQYVGSSWDELRHIRQAVGFLVLNQKPKKTLNEITKEICPVLSIQQLYRISTMYWDEKYGTHSLSTEVIWTMKVMMTEDSSNADSSNFLLDDDSSIPFSVDDISKTTQLVDITEVEVPSLIRENSEFGFLLPRSE